MMASKGLPDVGRWISMTHMGIRSKCEVLNHEETMDDIDDEFRKWLIEAKIFFLAKVRHPNGEEICYDEMGLLKFSWHYIEPPTEDDETTETVSSIERRNNILGHFCNYCETVRKNLLKCGGCKKVRYCSLECQSYDREDHEDKCGKLKMTLIHNPRYPLEFAVRKIGKRQRQLQAELSFILKAALNGRYEIWIQGHWRENAKATDLGAGKIYFLRCTARRKHEYQIIKGIMPRTHCESPTSCDLYSRLEILEEVGDSHRLTEVQWLVCAERRQNLSSPFWSMALNFNTFGTVAPFSLHCRCSFPKQPPKYRAIQKKWDKIFNRAKADPMDVQCMWADKSFGCHAYSLPGDLRCKFKHDKLTNIQDLHEDRSINIKDKEENFEEQISVREDHEKKTKTWQRKKTTKKKNRRF